MPLVEIPSQAGPGLQLEISKKKKKKKPLKVKNGSKLALANKVSQILQCWMKSPFSFFILLRLPGSKVFTRQRAQSLNN